MDVRTSRVQRSSSPGSERMMTCAPLDENRGKKTIYRTSEDEIREYKASAKAAEKNLLRLHQFLEAKSYVPPAPVPPPNYALPPPPPAQAAQISFVSPQWVPQSREESPNGSWPGRPKDVTPKRRKESLADLGLELMTTVQEAAMDSPTIPGRPPLFRSITQEIEPYDLRQLPIRKSSRDAVRKPLSPPRSIFSSDVSSSMATAEEKAERRASSILLPHGLAPLVIPSASVESLPSQIYRPSASTPDSTGSRDIPPRVPPKSPKTLIKAFPHPRKTPKTPVSANSNSTSSVCHTANSSVTSFSTNESRASPKPWASPIRGMSPRSPARALYLHEEIIPGTANGLVSNTGTIRAKDPPFPNKFRFNESVRAEAELPYSNSPPKSPRGPFAGHQRAESEASILNRGRPMKRGDMSLQRNVSRGLYMPESESFNEDLPTGIKPGIATKEMYPDELRRLRKLAEARATSYKVLREVDVTALTSELHMLDERCVYLQQTHSSLRKGRTDLHRRMMSMLRSPTTATFSRENLVKQEEALSELDQSIHEWLIKLSGAESRRQKVQKKLLEHTVAILCLSSSMSPTDEVSLHGQTPPRSPVTRCDFSPERREVESIRIYADHGVTSLLASIERDIEDMAEHRF
ncbi:hypothetical protein MMC25_005329 [Agyrium rufum]|nr:hypothetical protein [Agyrium rufum]